MSPASAARTLGAALSLITMLKLGQSVSFVRTRFDVDSPDLCIGLQIDGLKRDFFAQPVLSNGLTAVVFDQSVDTEPPIHFGDLRIALDIAELIARPIGMKGPDSGDRSLGKRRCANPMRAEASLACEVNCVGIRQPLLAGRSGLPRPKFVKVQFEVRR